MAAGSKVIKHLYDGTITMRAGAGVSLDVLFSMGDLSASGLQETQRAVIRYETRGEFHSARHGARTYPTGTFSYMVSDHSHATREVAIDFLRRTGAYAGNQSTLGASADVYTLTFVLTVEGTELGDDGDHTLTLEDCDFTFDYAEGEPNKITVNFTCNGDWSMT